MSAEFREDLKFEIGQLNNIIHDLSNIISSGEEFDARLTAYVAVAIHSFYNGAENSFRIILQLIGSIVPKGIDWHSQLLQEVSQIPSEQEFPLVYCGE